MTIKITKRPETGDISISTTLEIIDPVWPDVPDEIKDWIEEALPVKHRSLMRGIHPLEK